MSHILYIFNHIYHLSYLYMIKYNQNKIKNHKVHVVLHMYTFTTFTTVHVQQISCTTYEGT
jgi:hypothetical protein